jgi:hypothetical protein
MLFDLIIELLLNVLFELLAGALQAVFAHLINVDFAGNNGRLSGNPRAKLGWYAVAGAAAGGASAVIRPAPLALGFAVRMVGLVLMPIVSGLALTAWDVGRGRTGAGRGRASFWAGAAFGFGYVVVRLVVVWVVRAL